MSFSLSDHILLEDDFILVLHKPSGLMVEPDRNGHPNLLQEVKKYLQRQAQGTTIYAQHIHRLDRPVSGIILFAKQKSVLKNLSEQFAERRVKKYYQALTSRPPKQLTGILEHWHRKEKKKARLEKEPFTYAEKARLSYEVMPVDDQHFLWQIELHTGKYHQIRAQLGAEGCPILGDATYGSEMLFRPEAIALHAYRLIFYHPISGEEINIQQPHAFFPLPSTVSRG